MRRRLLCCLLLTALAVLQRPAVCYDDYYDPAGGYDPSYYADDSYDDPGAGDPEPINVIIGGVVDVDDLTFDKLTHGMPGPKWVVFYDVRLTDWMALRHEMELVGARMAKHLSLLPMKVNAATNPVLAKRFAIDAYPTFIYIPEGSQEAVRYEGPLDANEISTWLEERAGPLLVVPALRAPLSRFMSVEASGRQGVLEEVEAAISGLAPHELDPAEWCARIMRKVISKGDAYLGTERQRLTAMLRDAHSLKQEKVEEFEMRLTLLSMFRDEL